MPRPATLAATGRPSASNLKLAELRQGWRTNFLVHGPGAVIAERADCIVVRTPDNPAYYWGNCLVLPAGPGDDELDRWLQRFDHEVVRQNAACAHVALGINAPYRQEQLPRWRAAGFEIHISEVMRLAPGQLREPAEAARGDVVIRTIDFSCEVPAIIELECTDTDIFEPVGYRTHRQLRFLRHAQMHDEGRLHWFGAWCDGVLAAACGLMRERAQPGSVARFQHVYTHPDWRRRGLCTTLIAAVSTYAWQQWQVAELIMLADPDDVAIGIYRALGYAAIDSEWLLQRNAPQDRGVAR